MPPALSGIEHKYPRVMPTSSLWMLRHSEQECGLILLPTHAAAIQVNTTLGIRLNTLYLRWIFAHVHLSARVHVIFRRKTR